MFWSNDSMEMTTKLDRALLCRVCAALCRAQDAIEEIRGKNTPVHFSGSSFECHSICRALAQIIPECKVVDGRYAGMEMCTEEEVAELSDSRKSVRLMGATHTWLKTPDGSIIDPYPLACVTPSPLLIVTKGTYAPFGGNLYVQDPGPGSGYWNRRVWKRSQVLAQLMKGA